MRRAGPRAPRGRRRRRSRPPAPPRSEGRRDRRSSGRRSAASGITETVAAAAIGDSPHPSVRRITSRKRAPVSPAERRPRPTSGLRSRTPPRPGSGGAGRITVASGTSNRSGTCRMKIDCHSRSWVSRPPTAGPTAIPIVPAAPQTGAASSWLPRRRARSSIAQATASAPPGCLCDPSDDQDGGRPGRCAGDRCADEHDDARRPAARGDGSERSGPRGGSAGPGRG